MFQSFLKEKKVFFVNVDTKNITDNKFFWKTVKPFLVNKISSNPNEMSIIQKDEIISRSKNVAEIFNTAFENFVSNLSILIQVFLVTQ